MPGCLAVHVCQTCSRWFARRANNGNNFFFFFLTNIETNRVQIETKRTLRYFTILLHANDFHYYHCNLQHTKYPKISEVKLQSARPYESCKIFKGRPSRNAFSKLVYRQYKSFPHDGFCQYEIKKTTGLRNKHRTAYSCAEDQILENKNLRNMILDICTQQ